MKIDPKKLNLEMARAAINENALRDGTSPTTLQRIRRGEEVKPRTVGMIARALGVDPADILAEEDLP